MRNVKHGNYFVHGDFDFLFLHDDPAVRVQHGNFGAGVELFFLNFLFERCGRDDFNAFFATHDIPAELIAPFVEPGYKGCVRLLHVDEHGIVDGIAVEPGHGTEILRVSVALKQALDFLLNAISDFF